MQDPELALRGNRRKIEGGPSLSSTNKLIRKRVLGEGWQAETQSNLLLGFTLPPWEVGTDQLTSRLG